MAWRRTGTSQYLNQWWPSLLMHICVTRPQRVNSHFVFGVVVALSLLTHWPLGDLNEILKM